MKFLMKRLGKVSIFAISGFFLRAWMHETDVASVEACLIHNILFTVFQRTIDTGMYRAFVRDISQ